MESGLKRIVIAVIALGIGASAFASTPSKYNVSVPSQSSGWDVAFDALAIQPSNSALFYYQKKQVSPDHQFGFRVEGSYHLGQGEDVTLSWLRFNGRYRGPEAVGDNIVVPTTYVATADVRLNLDEVNLAHAEHFTIGSREQLRAYLASTFLRLDRQFHKNLVYSGGTVGTRVTDQNSYFNGAGFSGGFDSLYQLINNLSLALHGSAGLVAGDLELRQQETVTGGVTTPISSNNNIDTRTIVPIGELKLGLNYASLTSMGQLSLEGGYFVNGVFYAIHSMPFSGTSALPNPYTASNATFHGFYLTAKVDTSVG